MIQRVMQVKEGVVLGLNFLASDEGERLLQQPPVSREAAN